MNTVVHDLSDLLSEGTNSEKMQIEESISSATTQDEILDVSSENYFDEHVNEFRRYFIEHREQLEEGQNHGVLLESLQAAAKFLLAYPEISYSGIRVDFDGYVDKEWFLSAENPGDEPDDSAFWGDGDGAMSTKIRFFRCHRVRTDIRALWTEKESGKVQHQWCSVA